MDSFSNAYETVLDGAINNSQTTFDVIDVTGKPLDVPFRMRIRAETTNDNEIVTVTNVATNTFTVIRASESYNGVQTASAHSDGAIIEHVLTAQALKSASNLAPLDDDVLHATLGDEFDESSLNARWSLRVLYVDSFNFNYEGGSSLRIPFGVTDGEAITETAPSTDEWEARLTFTPYLTAGDPLFGIIAKSTAGTGVATCLRPNSGVMNFTTISSHVYSGQASTFDIVGRTPIKHWLSLRQKKATGGALGSQAIYCARLSVDGVHWGPAVSYVPTTFTLNELGVASTVNSGAPGWRPVFHRWNILNTLNVGNNLVRTPSSGTAAYSASAEYLGPGGTFGAQQAADGTTGNEWVTQNDTNPWWMVTWSVGQTLNRVRIYDVRGTFGNCHVEFSNGVKVPLETYVNNGWYFVDLPTTVTGVTTMKIIADSGTWSGFRGFAEVEAYLAS